MADATKIQWCDCTFNPWIGCAKVSPGCAHCYAEDDFDRRKGMVEWGPAGTRHVTSDANWARPLKWDRDAAAAGVRRRVFCASLADVFEARADLVEPRMRLFQLIGRTPHLDWLLLTKRPAVAADNWPLWCGYHAAARIDVGVPVNLADPFVLPNVWVGVSIEDQARADERVPLLLRIPAKVRFLSCEPLLDPLDLRAYLGTPTNVPWPGAAPERRLPPPYVDWVIVGGESGSAARPFLVDWARTLREQCRAAGVACFVKQLGTHPRALTGTGVAEVLALGDRKGGDPAEWPADLRVREFPAGGS